MIQQSPAASVSQLSWRDRALVALTCALVVGFYFAQIQGYVSQLAPTPPDGYYNRLIDGFAAGQLNLAVDVPSGLAALPDPYDPDANALFRGRLHDTSYYQGKIYIYFGVSPALLLFWPYHLLTGGYLSQTVAVAVFCSAGFLAAAGLLLSAWRRYFPEAPIALVLGGILALGFATTVPVMLARPDVWEIPIACGFALTMLALGAIWRALHDPAQAARWLTAASLAYGFAVGARPSLLPGAIVVFLPLLALRREPAARPGRLLLAAVLPLALIGAGLAVYNQMRFGSPFEFGQRYQMAGDRQDVAGHFSLNYLPYNLRLYFFSIVPWMAHFPFLGDVSAPPLPAGHALPENPCGIFFNTPISLLALVAPLAWRGRSDAGPLRWLAVALLLVFGSSALLLGMFYGVLTRYQVDFQPPLLVLAGLGGLGLTRVVWQSTWKRRACFALAAVALAYSAAFGVLKSLQGGVDRLDERGTAAAEGGRPEEAIELFDEALRREPARIETRYHLALAYGRAGRHAEEIAGYEEVLRLAPDHVAALGALASALHDAGRLAESVPPLEHAVRLNPDSFPLNYNLGATLLQLRRPAEAVPVLERTVRLRPDYALTRFQLAVALMMLGRAEEAREHYARARALDPSTPQLPL